MVIKHLPTAVDCGPLTIPNGVVEASSGTTFMMTATYTCNTGYVRVGSESRTCGATTLSDGVWSPAAPVCERMHVIKCFTMTDTSLLSHSAVSCGNPPTVTNSGRTSTGTTFGETTAYTCNTGYQRSGSATISCLASGSWSTAPVCRGKTQHNTEDIVSDYFPQLSVMTFLHCSME